MLLTTLVVLFACNGAELVPGPADPAAPPAAPPTAPAQGARAALGFTPGVDDRSAVERRLAELGITCAGVAAPARTMTLFDCQGDLPEEALTGREVRGTFDHLFLAVAEGGTLLHVSAVRRYSIPDAVGEDYQSTVALLTGSLGAPTRARAWDPAVASAPLFRLATTWTLPDLQVVVSAARLGPDYVSVEERWTVPQAAAPPERPGAAGHLGARSESWSGTVEGLTPPPGALPVEQVFQQASALDGQAVVVHGRVTKATYGILGKNWYHLADGTGTSEAGTDDLVATTAEDLRLEPGAVVTLRGLLAADVNLGFGYRYAAMLEDAQVVP